MLLMTVSMLEAYAVGRRLEIQARPRAKARERKRARKEVFGGVMVI